MQLTKEEVIESLKEKRKNLFPSYRSLFLLGFGGLVAVLASYDVISGTTAVISILVYLGVTLHRVLEGVFEQLEWLRFESAHQRTTNEAYLERLAELIRDPEA